MSRQRAVKGYDADAIRADLAKRNIAAVIPDRSNLHVKIAHNRALYKQRNRIERMLGHLKINRAIATRYAQLAETFLRHGPYRNRQILAQICPRRLEFAAQRYPVGAWFREI
jgi:transposase